MKRTLLAAILTMTVLGTFTIAGTTAEARKPGATVAPASITLNQSPVKLGDWVTFSYSVPDGVKSPRIQVMCYQGGVVTYGMALAASQAFELGGGSSDWRTNGGAADCTATLYQWDWHPVQTFVPYASVSFAAGGR